MPKMKVLSGMEIVRFLERCDFILVSQNGSHMKMVSESIKGSSIIIPRHRSIKRGLLKGIIRKCTEYLGNDIVKNFFYTK